MFCSVGDVLYVIYEVLNIERTALACRRRDSMFRPFAAQDLCKYCDLTQRQVAEILNFKSGASVSHQLNLANRGTPYLLNLAFAAVKYYDRKLGKLGTATY